VGSDAVTQTRTSRDAEEFVAVHPHPYTFGEEVANSIIHGLGAALSIAALTLLITFAAQAHNGWALGAGIVYGISLVLEYTASTLYHSFPQPNVKHVFKLLDHAGIYVLIAGTYTPFTLITLRDATWGPVSHVGLWLFGVVWALAVAGIATEASWAYRPRWVSAGVYPSAPGCWPCSLSPICAAGPAAWWPAGFATVGTVLCPQTRALRACGFHVFVLARSILHFLAVLMYESPF
jgi:hemolysin III